jgi:hypothetical protein
MTPPLLAAGEDREGEEARRREENWLLAEAMDDGLKRGLKGDALGIHIKDRLLENGVDEGSAGLSALLVMARLSNEGEGRSAPPKALSAPRAPEDKPAETIPEVVTGPAEAPAPADDFKISDQKSCSAECAPLPDRLYGEPPAVTLDDVAKPLREKPKAPKMSAADQIAMLKAMNTSHLPAPLRHPAPGSNEAPLRREDIFPPDHPAESMQGPQEVVRLGRIPGSRGIRRV